MSTSTLRTVRGYELHERIGAGGFGEVYRAYQPSVERQVAIKVILPQYANHPDFMRRFETEAQLVARLEHPHIVPLHDYWREPDGAYLVMRWLQGGNLYDALQRGPWSPEAAAQLLNQIAGALDVAHRQGVVHRDVKPENILLDQDGNAYLSDFGIAKDLLRATRATAPDAATGSLLYISPEQAQSQPVTPQSDLYSLGIVMYEVLTGEHPFHNLTPATVLVKLITEPLPPLRERQPDLPPALQDVIQRATAKDPAGRYPDALAFAAAFRDALSEQAAPETEIPLQPPAFLTAEVQAVERPVFVARERELERLDEFLQAALEGEGQVVFITGGPGRGKTALVDEFARRAMQARPDLLVASGGCNAYSGVGDPYLPFREVMAMLTADVEGRWAAGAITRDHAWRLWAALPLVVRELLDHGPHLVDVFFPGAALLSRATSAAQDGAPWLEPLRAYAERQRISSVGLEQSHLFQQVTNVLRALAEERPLLLILDDVQWVDSASIGLLFHLGRRLGGSRVLIACAYRPEEVALDRDGERHPLEKVLSEFKRRIGDVWVHLGETQEAEGRRFVDAFLEAEPNRLDEAFRQALFRHTGGHPLFTVELLRAMQERGDLLQDEDGQWVMGAALDWETLPARVEGVIEERVGRLEEELREILTVASVEGEEFTAQVVARVGEIGERQLLRALSQELAKRHRLVREQGELAVARQRLSRYRFAHALFQGYLYKGLSEGERRLLHREIGAVLEELYAGHQEEIAAQLARHYAGDAEKERRYARLAGERAAAAYANDEALRHLSRALELTPETDSAARYTLLLAREKVYDFQGARETQAQDLAALEALAETLDDDRRRAEVALRQTNYAGVTSDFPAAIAAAQAAIRLAQATQDEANGALANEMVDIEATGYFEWGRTLYFQGNYDAARPQLEQALTLARAAGLRQVEADTLRHLGNVSWGQGGFVKARPYLEQALAIHREIGDRLGECSALNYLGFTLRRQHDYAEARAYYEQALRISREMGGRYLEGMVLGNLAFIFGRQGDYVRAKAHCRQALAIRQEVGDRSGESWALAVLGLIFHHQGNDRVAQEHIQQALSIAQDIRSRNLEGAVLTFLGHALAGLGLLAEAADAYRSALDIARDLNRPDWATEPLAGLARVALAQGDALQAQAHVEEISSHLESGTLDETEEPFRIYLTCYRVLKANQDPRAEEILDTARRLLQEQAAKIMDEELRRSFLGNVAAHREILAAWDRRP